MATKKKGTEKKELSFTEKQGPVSRDRADPDQVIKADADAAAMRGALEHVARRGFAHASHHRDECPALGRDDMRCESCHAAALINDSLSGSAGKAFLDRVAKLDAVAQAAATVLARSDSEGPKSAAALEALRVALVDVGIQVEPGSAVPL
jgi:cytochrome c